MLRLRVQTPDQRAPITEIAYANLPFVNYATIKKQACPVQFWYHHPATPAVAGVEFLQTPDGKLYGRVGENGAYQARGEVTPGEPITVSPERRITLLRSLPHARQQGTFLPLTDRSRATNAAEAAALVELTTAGASERFWLRRNDAQMGIKKLEGSGGPLLVMFGYERRPLGFHVKLVDFHRDGASCVSRVSLSEGAPGPTVVRLAASNPLRTIATNRPLRYGTFTFSQAGFQPAPERVELSVLRVTSDPGRYWKYAGGALMCGGLVCLAWRRVSGWRAGAAGPPQM